jgi:hypothetical protein
MSRSPGWTDLLGVGLASSSACGISGKGHGPATQNLDKRPADLTQLIAKDHAIRGKHEQRLLADIDKLSRRIAEHLEHGGLLGSSDAMHGFWGVDLVIRHSARSEERSG